MRISDCFKPRLLGWFVTQNYCGQSWLIQQSSKTQPRVLTLPGIILWTQRLRLTVRISGLFQVSGVNDLWRLKEGQQQNRGKRGSHYCSIMPFDDCKQEEQRWKRFTGGAGLMRLGMALCLLASFPFFSQELPIGHGAGNLAIGLKCGLT